MICKLIIIAFAFLNAIPAFSHSTQLPTVQALPALRLMNDSEFATFLGNLDADMLHSQEQLKKMDVQSVTLDLQEREELEKSYNRCLQSLDDAREEIQKLSQKQTLKLDLFLLIDLNELARSLDSLDQSLVNPMAVSGSSGAQKTLGYARKVLAIDGAIATDISTFQHHFLAFAGVVDATLDQSDFNVLQPQTHK